MSAFQNIGIHDYIKRYGLRYGLGRALYLSLPIHYIDDYENKKILYYKKTKKYLEKNYIKFAETDINGIEYNKNIDNEPIWVYWKQGVENAPEIVKKCISSVIKYNKENTIVLDDKNINDYIKLPNNLLEKNNKGKMSNAALSDIIRLALLEHYGGTWIDATVYLTGSLPQFILKSDFFAFQDKFGLIQNAALVSNWLIHAKKHNEIIREALNMTTAYWVKESYVKEYLFVYILLEMAMERNVDKGMNIPYANSDYCHLLLDILDHDFNEDEFEHIKELSTIHKLTYKLNECVNENNSYYNHLFR